MKIDEALYQLKQNIKMHKIEGTTSNQNEREKALLDYITNLQEENDRLKELCDKYEEEHSTTFNEWKETITDKYQTLKDLQEENERLENRNIYYINNEKKLLSDWHQEHNEAIECKSRNEKANWWLKEMLKQAKSDETKAIINGTLELLLNGSDEELLEEVEKNENK